MNLNKNQFCFIFSSQKFNHSWVIYTIAHGRDHGLVQFDLHVTTLLFILGEIHWQLPKIHGKENLKSCKTKARVQPSQLEQIMEHPKC